MDTHRTIRVASARKIHRIDITREVTEAMENSAARFLSEAIGTSRLLVVEKGKPCFGRWKRGRSGSTSRRIAGPGALDTGSEI